MVATSRGEARQQGGSDDSDASDDERDNRASPKTGDDEHMNGGARVGRELLFWPIVREVDGKKENKHVRVCGDGDTSKRVAGDCTRVAFDPRDLAASDSKGGYRLLPDEELKRFYRPQKVKREAIFWPAVRTVDGEEEYKHVRVYDPPHARGGDCVGAQQLKECPCDQRSGEGKGRCSCYRACECDDCTRKSAGPCVCDNCALKPAHLRGDCTAQPAGDSAQVPFDNRDLIATDGRRDYRLLPDHEVLSLFFHDETTAKENDDEDHQWMSAEKGAAMKVNREVRAAHISDVIGVDLGQLQISQEAWGMMQEDKDVTTGRSGKYFGRKGEGVKGHEVKEVQDAVEVLKAAAADCEELKMANDPQTAAVIMPVGQQHDGYWTSDDMCAQLPAIIAMAELTSGPHRQGVFIFDNSTGHNPYDADALLAHNINLAPGGEKVALRVFEDVDGKKVYPTFQLGDTLLTDRKIFLPKTEEQKKNKKRKSGTALDKDKFPVGTKVVLRSPLLGLNKGGEQMLREMGLWRLRGEKRGLVKGCNKCKADNAAARQAIAAFNKGGEERERVLEQAWWEQQKFFHRGSRGSGRGCWKEAALNKVEQIFKEAGHVCIFLPKYHPELNAIERYWGSIKHVLRLHCEISLTHMLEILRGAMSGVPLDHIRAWSRVVWLYVEAYDDGLEGYLKDREAKEWHTHRQATRRGNAVVEATGGGESQAEEDKVVAKALAASQENRTFSVRRAKRALKKWKKCAMANVEEEK
ncbi:unnamed protein product [Ectocarpus sp. CCAP 1310/34]|nr:unnamed protein product [Ectocarpus sp. CCAP 1310/34]